MRLQCAMRLHARMPWCCRGGWRSVDRSVGRSVRLSVSPQSVDQLVGRSVGRLVTPSCCQHVHEGTLQSWPIVRWRVRTASPPVSAALPPLRFCESGIRTQPRPGVEPGDPLRTRECRMPRAMCTRSRSHHCAVDADPIRKDVAEEAGQAASREHVMPRRAANGDMAPACLHEHTMHVAVNTCTESKCE